MALSYVKFNMGTMQARLHGSHAGGPAWQEGTSILWFAWVLCVFNTASRIGYRFALGEKDDDIADSITVVSRKQKGCQKNSNEHCQTKVVKQVPLL